MANLNSSVDKMLPYNIIESASTGNVDAINEVLKHYQRYMIKLATRTLYDENGTPHQCVDEEMIRRMETKLITRILNFKLVRTS